MIAFVLAAAVVAPLQTPPARPCAPPLMSTQAPAAPPRARKLGELPDAMAIRAVMRQVGGCPYMDVIRFKVSQESPSYPSGTLAPAGGRVEPAVPTGDGH
jgi:hypothetical protein